MGERQRTTQAGWRQIPTWIADHELWLLLPIVELLVLPNRYTWAGLALIPLLWLCRRLARGHLTVHTPMDFPIMTLLIMLPVSLYASPDRALSQVVLYQIVAGVAFFYGLVNGLRSRSAVAWAVVGLIGVGVALAVVAPVSVQWPGSKLFALPRIYRHFSLLLPETINGNVMAGALATIIPVVAALLLYSRFSALTREQRLSLRTGLGLILALMSAVFFLTQSRGGFIALAIGMLILASARWQWLVTLGAGYGLALAATARYVEPTTVVDLIFGTDTIRGWAGRQEVWLRAVWILQNFSYTGVGLGTFQPVVRALYPFYLFDPDVEVPHAHNLFLQAGVDLGLPGLVAFVALLTTGFLLTWQTFRRSRIQERPDQQALAFGLFVSLAVVVAHGLTDAVTWWGAKPAVIQWTVLGLSMALYRVCNGRWSKGQKGGGGGRPGSGEIRRGHQGEHSGYTGA